MYGRDEREEIGNQGEENVKFLLAQHFGQSAIQDVSGQDGEPDIYLAINNNRMVIDVKTMLPFSIDKDKHGKKVRKVGYAHINRTSWEYLNKYARERIANVSVIVEVRFRHHPYIYFLLKRQDVEEFISNSKPTTTWINIPLWYIHERGIGFTNLISPEFDWCPVDTAQKQIEGEKNG